MSHFPKKENKEPEVKKLLIEAAEHLEYCNYGDNWENECARDSGLVDRITKFLKENNHER